MRAIAEALSQLVPHFAGADFLPPQANRADDQWYRSQLSTEAAKGELHDFWLHWGLDNQLLLPDLVLLSVNLADSQAADTLTRDFVHDNNTLPTLGNHLCFALATTCALRWFRWQRLASSWSCSSAR